MDIIDLTKEDVSTIVYEVVNAKAASPENQGKRAPKPLKRTYQGIEKSYLSIFGLKMRGYVQRNCV